MQHANAHPVSVAADHRATALTPRGTGAARLSDFQDIWANLTAEDRAYFAEWLAELLVDACQEPTV